MTKNELIDQMALNAGISRKSANKALEALIEPTSASALSLPLGFQLPAFQLRQQMADGDRPCVPCFSVPPYDQQLASCPRFP